MNNISESNILCHPGTARELVDIHHSHLSAANAELSAAANFRSLNNCGRVSICGARPSSLAIIYAFAFVFIAAPEFMGAVACAKNT
jgi:hypothetical protein